MLFKRLEITGFKSFARAVNLDFPVNISAIVGPNGSGKSNIADAIRWVLGEQSMKHLRGKRGEDLIFAGTQQTARLGKAAVSLFFDNLPDRQAGKKHIFPVEFEEVAVSRRIYRDGTNEYLLNGSQVRLKDIVELLSKVGLGVSQHHIIAQGDADRILYASPKERKSMAEEALGLKIFELKKKEAERKIEATEENIKQVESLRREIQPHLKFLHLQAEKSKNAAELSNELELTALGYVSRELKTISEEAKYIEEGKEPLEKKARELESSINKASEAFLGEGNNAKKFFEEIKKHDDILDSIFEKRRSLEKVAMRLELESAKSSSGAENTISKERVRGVVLDFLSDLEGVSRLGTMEAVRNTIFSLTQKIYGFLESLNGHAPGAQKGADALSKIRSEIGGLEKEEETLKKQKEKLKESYEEKASRVQKENMMYKERAEALSEAKDALRIFAGKVERLSLIKKELEIDFVEWVSGAKPGGEALTESERASLRKKIERLRIRLEEAGGVDDSVIKEYEDTKKRDEFLGKELEDLKKTLSSLEEVFSELETRIEKDFDLGISKINKLFGEFFHEIFGGGRAEIRILKPEKKKKPELAEENVEWEIEDEEPGLDIMVDIPRKRIKSLSMLSGGERALVSIALLFAMSTVNPPPFLVLDETDAALDEANSKKYGAMLKDLGKKTQLIVVTHNRETMKAADVLYGVTMGGDGVSKLLSLKFEEAEEVLAKRK